nr:MAG TPA: hypothetical protein [Caudoviricetes sp.]
MTGLLRSSGGLLGSRGVIDLISSAKSSAASQSADFTTSLNSLTQLCESSNLAIYCFNIQK